MSQFRNFVATAWPADRQSAKNDQARLARVVPARTFKITSARIALAIGVSYSEANSLAVAVGFPCTPFARPLASEPYIAIYRVEFPYIPGMFAYREGPAVEQLVRSLNFTPDLLIFDSQGLAHPHRFGLASHLGLLLDIPSIGITRNRLFGRYQEPPESDGARTPLYGRDKEIVGFAFRPLAHCDAVFVSPGFRMSLDSVETWLNSFSVIRSCFPGAVAEAHSYANRLARSPSELLTLEG